MAARFAASPFAHNGPVALALSPSLCFALAVSGGAGQSCAAVGCALAYCCDLLRAPEATLGIVWCTVVALYLCLLLGGGAGGAAAVPQLLEVLQLCCLGQTLFLGGVWATLQARACSELCGGPLRLPSDALSHQFRFLQFHSPGVVLAAERLLLAAAPLSGGAVGGWALCRAVGPASAPFALSAYLTALYFALALPRRSSFCTASPARRTSASASTSASAATASDAAAMAPRDAALQALATVATPMALYAALHLGALRSPSTWSWAALRDHGCSLLLLASAPVLATTLADSAFHALWWLPGEPGGVAVSAGAAASLTAFALGFEGRVLLRDAAPYLRAAPPWDVALVTLSVLCCAWLAAALWTAGPAKAAALAPARAAATLAALAAALALGMPLWMAPLPPLAALGALHFLASLSRAGAAGAGGHYALAAATTLCCVSWFLRTHFMRLDETLAGGMLALTSLCHGLLLACALALAAPGLALPASLRGRHSPGAAALLTAHAVVMITLEAVLVQEDAGAPASGIYPIWLFVGTSCGALALVHALRQRKRLPRAAAWAVAVLHAAKAPLLLTPRAAALPRAVALLAAASAPFALFPRRGGAAGMLSGWRGLAHCAAFVAALLHARFLLFDALFALTGRRPSDALLCAAFLMMGGLFLASLAARHYPASTLPARCALLMLTAGLGLLLLRPPLPWKGDTGGWFYDAEHVPDPEPDDAGMYGAAQRHRLAKSDGAPAWALILAAAAAAVALVGRGAGRSNCVGGGSGAGADFASACAGGAFGVYVASEYLPADGMLVGACACACACSALGVVRATHGRSKALPALLLAQVATLPLALTRVYGDALAALMGGSEAAAPSAEARAEQRDATAALCAVHAALAVALAFSAHLRFAGATQRPRARRSEATVAALAHDPFSQWLATRVPAAAQPLAPPLARLAVVGDAASWLAFGLCCALHGAVGAPDTALLLLAPPLLLLNRPPRRHSPTAQYAPVAAAMWAVLSLKSVAAAVQALGLSGGAALEAPLWFLLANGAALAATAPSCALFVRFLAGAARPHDGMLLAATPAPAMSVLLTSLPPLRLLSLLALAAGVTQQVAQGRRRAANARAL